MDRELRNLSLFVEENMVAARHYLSMAQRDRRELPQVGSVPRMLAFSSSFSGKRPDFVRFPHVSHRFGGFFCLEQGVELGIQQAVAALQRWVAAAIQLWEAPKQRVEVKAKAREVQVRPVRAGAQKETEATNFNKCHWISMDF